MRQPTPEAPSEHKAARGKSPFPSRLLVALALGGAVLAVWNLWSRWGGRSFAPKPLNIVLVTADTLRADKLGCYGNETVETPNLDRLAASGVLFENASTSTPVTLPAHATLFTGTYPIFHGVRDNGGYYLEPDQVTLAESLQTQGYTTGAFVSAFVLDARFGLDQGFDRYFDDFDLSKVKNAAPSSVYRRGDEVLFGSHRMDETTRRGRTFLLMDSPIRRPPTLRSARTVQEPVSKRALGLLRR